MRQKSIPRLTKAGCLQRQARLQTLQQDLDLDALLFTNRHYVYWLTGYWHEQILTPTAALLSADGTCVLVTHCDSPDVPATQEILPYEPQKLCTLVENLDEALCQPLIPRLEGIKRLGVDEHGFDEMDRRLLEAIVEKFDGGPVGLETLAATMGEEADTVESVYEPFLIKEGFIKRTPRGRVAMSRTYALFGVHPKSPIGPTGTQPPLFGDDSL